MIATRGSTVNEYAPFYLWTRAEALAGFLGGPLFGAVVASFGRLRVECWLGTGFRAPLGAPAGAATYAVLRIAVPELGVLRSVSDA
jgi:hypothetical protein